MRIFSYSRPGFTRLNLSFFANDYEIEYILHAVQFVATEGWKFLPLVSKRSILNVFAIEIVFFSIRTIQLRLVGVIEVVSHLLKQVSEILRTKLVKCNILVVKNIQCLLGERKWYVEMNDR